MALGLPPGTTNEADTSINGIDENLVFGNVVLGSIHAFKYEDVDGNGKYDETIDFPIAGIPFELRYNGGLVPGRTEPWIELSMDDGEVWWVGIPPGDNYSIHEILDPTMTQYVNSTPTVVSDIFVGSRSEVVYEVGASDRGAGSSQHEVVDERARLWQLHSWIDSWL